METLVRTAGRGSRPGRRHGHRGAVLLASALALAACAHAPADPEARAEFQRNNDPAEPTNRAVFRANQFVDRNALRPVARGYAEYVPGAVRSGLHNFVA